MPVYELRFVDHTTNVIHRLNIAIIPSFTLVWGPEGPATMKLKGLILSKAKEVVGDLEMVINDDNGMVVQLNNCIIYINDVTSSAHICCTKKELLENLLNAIKSSLHKVEKPRGGVNIVRTKPSSNM